MIKTFALFPLLALFMSTAQGAQSGHSILLSAKTQTATEPLTTEKVWDLDPLELNPHRQNWLLNRDVRAEGLKADYRQGHYGVILAQVVSLTRVYTRAPGPWYQEISTFSCQREPNAWFSTAEGTQIAGEAAAKHWDELLSDKLQKLTLQLNRVNESKEEKALMEGRRLFAEWLDGLEVEWQAEGKHQARLAEWKSYRTTCLSGKPVTAVKKIQPAQSLALRGQEIFDPVPPTGSEQIFARLPARRWNGLYTIRLSMDVGGKRLNGQFLLDSGSLHSLISPDFLAGQGIPPEALVLKGLHAQKVKWAEGSAVARAIGGYTLSLGNQEIPFKDLLMTETELFIPPQFVSTCCDGVLGIDFLRQYAVEFRAGPPVEIILWPRAGFHHEATRPWTEVSTTSTGDLISAACIADTGSLASKAAPPVVGARWDTGSEYALEVHATQFEKARKTPWTLTCGSQKIATRIDASPQDKNGLRFSHGKIANVGMPILGRGDTTLDLSHGRIWFTEKTLQTRIYRNESGLGVRFKYESDQGDRILQVVSIAPKSSAALFAKQTGIKVGTRLTQVDSKPIEELDLWNINQRLAGAFGTAVKLEWDVGTRHTTKLGKVVKNPILKNGVLSLAAGNVGELK